MIDLYAWPTPNGFKVSIMLEETGMNYRVIPVDIRNGDQFKPDFLKISPNNRMPAIVDTDGPGGTFYSLFESGAILMYLADKAGAFLPSDVIGRYQVIQWLMWQMGGIGPMLGQAHHFRQYAPEKLDYAVDRYTKEANRLYGVLDKRLAEAEYMAGDYSIADMATFPWLRRPERQGVDIAEYPNVARWREEMMARPAVVRGLELLKEYQDAAPMDAKAREMLFGNTQFQRR